MTPTTQFRIPSATKTLFKDICVHRSVSMPHVVINSIERYIAEQTRDPAVTGYLR
jgi:hypothetical protein